MSSEEVVNINTFKHHIRGKICNTRSQYRKGRRETSIKVFTISDESKYLLIHNVPDIKGNVKQELFKLCQRFGDIEKLCLSDYPNCEEFTKVYLIKYRKFVNAVMAKKSLDDKNFLGSILHVCYAPELESIDETKEKLSDRKRYVIQKLSQMDQKSNSKISQNSELQSCQINTLEVDSKANEPNHSSQTQYNPIPSVSHQNQVQLNPKTVKKGDESETLKRKLSQDSHEDMRLEVKSKISKLSSVTPKIRWRK